MNLMNTVRELIHLVTTEHYLRIARREAMLAAEDIAEQRVEASRHLELHLRRAVCAPGPWGHNNNMAPCLNGAWREDVAPPSVMTISTLLQGVVMTS